MKTNPFIIAGVVVLALVAGYFFFFSGGGQEAGTPSQLGVPAPGNESVPETVVEPPDREEESPPPDQEGAPTVSSAKEISMASGNLFFAPKSLTLAKDQQVKITFSNSGFHTFTIDELDVNQSLRGSTVTVEFTPTETGTFEYYCAVPGHKEGGMSGSLIVE